MNKQRKLFCREYAKDFDVHRAAEVAGYSGNYKYQLIKDPEILKEIKLIVQGAMALKAGKALGTIESVMDNKSASAANTSRLNAANSLLDRAGLGKQETLEIKAETPNGLFIIPAKKAPESEEL